MPMHRTPLLCPRRNRLLVLSVAIFGVAGCHRVTLTPQEQAVRVIRDQAQVSQCKFVQEVESSDRLSGGLVNREKAEETAYMILKQKASKLGANTVLLSTASSGYSGAAMKGKAYTCSAS
jgi:hypothetical protein